MLTAPFWAISPPSMRGLATAATWCACADALAHRNARMVSNARDHSHGSGGGLRVLRRSASRRRHADQQRGADSVQGCEVCRHGIFFCDDTPFSLSHQSSANTVRSERASSQRPAPDPTPEIPSLTHAHACSHRGDGLQAVDKPFGDATTSEPASVVGVGAVVGGGVSGVHSVSVLGPRPNAWARYTAQSIVNAL